jgi:hypothetical protein
MNELAAMIVAADLKILVLAHPTPLTHAIVGIHGDIWSCLPSGSISSSEAENTKPGRERQHRFRPLRAALAGALLTNRQPNGCM